jgi:hypothetical protein
MKAPKRVSPSYSAWQFVGNDVLKALRGEPKRTISSSQIVAIIVTAINPAALAASVKNNKARELARVFSDFYTAKPDLTLRLLQVIRKRWNDDSFTSKVQKRLTTEAWFEKPQWKDGKLIANGILMQDAKDVNFDQDRDRTVQKARQRIRPVPLLNITTALYLAMKELQHLGFDVGTGL